jgi:hypothetical protein
MLPLFLCWHVLFLDDKVSNHVEGHSVISRPFICECHEKLLLTCFVVFTLLQLMQAIMCCICYPLHCLLRTVIVTHRWSLAFWSWRKPRLRMHYNLHCDYCLPRPKGSWLYESLSLPVTGVEFPRTSRTKTLCFYGISNEHHPECGNPVTLVWGVTVFTMRKAWLF